MSAKQFEVNTGSLEIDGKPASVNVKDDAFFGYSDITTITEAGYKSERAVSIIRTKLRILSDTGILSGEIRRAIKKGHRVTSSDDCFKFRKLGPVAVGVGNNRISIGKFGLKKALDLK